MANEFTQFGMRTGNVDIPDYDLAIARKLGGVYDPAQNEWYLPINYRIECPDKGPIKIERALLVTKRPEPTQVEHKVPQIVISMDDMDPDPSRLYSIPTQYRLPAAGSQPVCVEMSGTSMLGYDCVHPNTWLFTEEGLRQAHEVCAGDKLLSEDGRFHEVERAWSTVSNKDIVSIYPSGWTGGFHVTSDHRMLVLRKDTPTWVEARELEEGDALYFPRVQRSGGEWSRLLPGSEISITPQFCRFLGYFLGDGSLASRRGVERMIVASFGEPDKYLSDYINIVAEFLDRKVTVYREEPNQQGTFGHKELAEWLRETCYDHSGDKRAPLNLLLSLPDEHLREFIVGLMRTDGCISLQGGGKTLMARFTQVSASVAQAFFLISARLGLHPAIDRRVQTTTNIQGRDVSGRDWWSIRFAASGSEQIMEWLGAQFEPCKKRKKLWEVTDGFVSTKIRRLERTAYNGIVYDFAVRDVHSFTGPWSVAHNCYETKDQEQPYNLTYTIEAWARYKVAALNLIQIVMRAFPLRPSKPTITVMAREEASRNVVCPREYRFSQEGFADLTEINSMVERIPGYALTIRIEGELTQDKAPITVGAFTGTRSEDPIPGTECFPGGNPSLPPGGLYGDGLPSIRATMLED